MIHEEEVGDIVLADGKEWVDENGELVVTLLVVVRAVGQICDHNALGESNFLED